MFGLLLSEPQSKEKGECEIMRYIRSGRGSAGHGGAGRGGARRGAPRPTLTRAGTISKVKVLSHTEDSAHLTVVSQWLSASVGC